MTSKKTILFHFGRIFSNHSTSSTIFAQISKVLNNSFVANRRVTPRDRSFLTLHQKNFNLGKTRSATTDYVTRKATVDVCNRTDYVAHD